MSNWSKAGEIGLKALKFGGKAVVYVGKELINVSREAKGLEPAFKEKSDAELKQQVKTGKLEKRLAASRELKQRKEQS
ncbi:hypothetical protein AB2S62_19715 [Vibrio sp. NTOU-M3]|uniref:hypothetical protein n=1 Tax=Vibrio sp. NTOU-M3 TaxID=3234954 RepID=UPI00349F81BC